MESALADNEFVQRIEVVEKRLLAFVGNVSLFILRDMRIIFSRHAGNLSHRSETICAIQFTQSIAYQSFRPDELVFVPSGFAAILRAVGGEPNGRSRRQISVLWPTSVPIHHANCANGKYPPIDNMFLASVLF